MEREPGKEIRQTIIATDSSKLAEVKTRSSSGLRKVRRRVSIPPKSIQRCLQVVSVTEDRCSTELLFYTYLSR
jgi:hypothetical protein